MINTVVLRGKGMGAAIFFHAILQEYPNATWHDVKLRWWQSTTRYELRMQNLSHDEIRALSNTVSNTNWPLTTWIDMEVF